MDAAELLDRTADVIEERGHAKESLEDEDGRVCLVGGLNVAAFGKALNTLDTDASWSELLATLRTREQAVDALSAYLGVGRFGLVPWNNAPEREPFEVTDACRHAAKVLRGG